MTHSLSKSELEEIYNFALDLGRRAGQILIEGVNKRTGEASERGDNAEVEKMNAVDIVTQTDLGRYCPIAFVKLDMRMV
jgi:myo-inositol-1(or 4)-monophosphatase